MVSVGLESGHDAIVCKTLHNKPRVEQGKYFLLALALIEWGSLDGLKSLDDIDDESVFLLGATRTFLVGGSAR